MVGVLRAFGGLDFALDSVRWAAQHANLDTRFVDALSTALVNPLSGNASRAMLIETMHHCGVGIRRVRHTVGCALLAELAGVSASIGVCYWFFG